MSQLLKERSLPELLSVRPELTRQLAEQIMGSLLLQLSKDLADHYFPKYEVGDGTKESEARIGLSQLEALNAEDLLAMPLKIKEMARIAAQDLAAELGHTRSVEPLGVFFLHYAQAYNAQKKVLGLTRNNVDSELKNIAKDDELWAEMVTEYERMVADAKAEPKLLQQNMEIWLETVFTYHFNAAQGGVELTSEEQIEYELNHLMAIRSILAQKSRLFEVLELHKISDDETLGGVLSQWLMQQINEMKSFLFVDYLYALPDFFGTDMADSFFKLAEPKKPVSESSATGFGLVPSELQGEFDNSIFEQALTLASEKEIQSKGREFALSLALKALIKDRSRHRLSLLLALCDRASLVALFMQMHDVFVDAE